MSKIKIAMTVLGPILERLGKAFVRWAHRRKRRRLHDTALILVACCALSQGCKLLDAAEWIGTRFPEPEPPPVVVVPDEPAPAPKPAPKPEPPKGEWRTDVAEIPMVNGWATYWRKDMTIPTKRNKDGGHEYINAWVDTDKGRVLYMAMYDRSGSRIYSEAGGPRLRDKPWPMPLMGEHRWDYVQDGSDLVVMLDGEEFDRRRGVRVKRIRVNGAHNRECTGAWRQ